MPQPQHDYVQEACLSWLTDELRSLVEAREEAARRNRASRRPLLRLRSLMLWIGASLGMAMHRIG